jgi:hypothetical protein
MVAALAWVFGHGPVAPAVPFLDRDTVGVNAALDPVNHPHLDYGYAVTCHSSQGQTADRVLIYANTELGVGCWVTVDFRRLAQSGGEVGQGEEGGVNFFHEFAVRFGFVVDTLPLRVVLEGFPVGDCRFAARMLKNVDKCVALLRLIEGRPISNAFHSVAVKEFYGVFAEA